MEPNSKTLEIDCEAEARRICAFIVRQVKHLKRDGVVIGLSGGVDSAVCSELCVKALGADRVLGVILPEKESAPVSAEYAVKQAEKLNLKTETMDITKAIEGFGVYDKRDEAIQAYVPGYDPKWKSKIMLPGELLHKDNLNYYKLIIENDEKHSRSVRLDNRTLRKVVAATNVKQRARMVSLYYYAELNNYIVCGTTNKSEYIQGFFVKYGDGGVDIEPMQHLYKIQVYQLARYFGVIDEIIKRTPTPDTFGLVVSDEEMYFRMPYEVLDPLLYSWENGISNDEVRKTTGFSEEQIERVYRDFRSKLAASEYQKKGPVMLNNKRQAKSIVRGSKRVETRPLT